MSVKIAPDSRRQYINANGAPYSGAKLFYYASGSTTKQNTYTTSVGDVANSNPIVLDSAGRTPYGVWLTAGLTYKEVLAPSTDTDPPGSPIYTEDGISGINDTAVTTSQWVASSLTPTYISGTSFSVPGDQTNELHIGRRLQLSVTAGTVYARISNSVYGAFTTVTVVMDSGTLDSGLTSFNWSILTATNHALPKLSAASLAAISILDTATAGTTYAPLASPTLTGTPLSTTAAVDTSTTQIATTAFVTNQAASATPLTAALAGVVGTSKRYARGDHVHPISAISSIVRVATTSTALISLSTAIPSWAKRITLTFVQVSTSGTSPVLIQIGDSGGIETTGYTSGYGNNNTAGSAGAAVSSAGFLIPGVAATDTRSGTLTLTLNDSVTNTWTASGCFYANSTQVGFTAGDKVLSATLTSISVTTAGGTDTFDNGSIGMLYE